MDTVDSRGIPIDKETMKLAMVLTLKKNMEALLKQSQEETSIAKAAQIYRAIADLLEVGQKQLDMIDKAA